MWSDAHRSFTPTNLRDALVDVRGANCRDMAFHFGFSCFRDLGSKSIWFEHSPGQCIRNDRLLAYASYRSSVLVRHGSETASANQNHSCSFSDRYQRLYLSLDRPLHGIRYFALRFLDNERRAYYAHHVFSAEYTKDKLGSPPTRQLIVTISSSVCIWFLVLSLFRVLLCVQIPACARVWSWRASVSDAWG